MFREIELAFVLPFAASWFATGSTVSWGKKPRWERCPTAAGYEWARRWLTIEPTTDKRK
jgi:hypothetical protein